MWDPPPGFKSHSHSHSQSQSQSVSQSSQSQSSHSNESGLPRHASTNAIKVNLNVNHSEKDRNHDRRNENETDGMNAEINENALIESEKLDREAEWGYLFKNEEKKQSKMKPNSILTSFENENELKIFLNDRNLRSTHLKQLFNDFHIHSKTVFNANLAKVSFTHSIQPLFHSFNSLIPISISMSTHLHISIEIKY